MKILCLVPLVLFAGCASRAPSPEAPAKVTLPVAHTVDPRTVIDGPPADGSKKDREDLKAVLKLQSSRTKEECTRAEDEADPTLETLFGPLHGPLSENEAARLDGGFRQILNEAAFPVILKAKNIWSRARPAVRHPKQVHPCLKVESKGSYPSGHATIAVLYAETLSLLFPERAEAFRARAREIGQDRVLAGVHYPSDITDGEALGRATFTALSDDPAFHYLIDSIKASLKQP